jgi:hypothetical protein
MLQLVLQTAASLLTATSELAHNQLGAPNADLVIKRRQELSIHVAKVGLSSLLRSQCCFPLELFGINSSA